MPIQPIPAWADSYDAIFNTKSKQTPDGVETTPAFEIADQPLLWQKWVHENVNGVGGAPPFAAAGTVNQSAFPPVGAPAPGAPPIPAALIASGWMAYMSAITWAPPAPVPPFSVITSVLTSPVGLATGYASILAALLTDMALLPPPPPAMEAVLKSKAMTLSTAFYTSTLACGIMITGLSLPAPTPAPLVIPLSPLL